jgi:hypothetical protein
VSGVALLVFIVTVLVVVVVIYFACIASVEIDNLLGSLFVLLGSLVLCGVFIWQMAKWIADHA